MMAELDDFGFARTGRAFAALRIADQRRAEELLAVTQASVAAVLQIIDHRVQTGSYKRSAVHQLCGEMNGYRKGAVAQRAIQLIGCRNMREDELLESVDAILQFLKMVLINSGHGGESPDVSGPDLPKPTPDARHRLSESEK